MQFQENILGLIGHTPLVKLNRLARGVKAQVFAKMENLNPGYSVKDRIGIAMIEAAEREGTLKPGGTIVEATSGNTGIGLAKVCAAKGYRRLCSRPSIGRFFPFIHDDSRFRDSCVKKRAAPGTAKK